MKIKISKSALLQYALIYILLLIPGSCLYQVYLGDYKYFILLALYIIFALSHPKFRNNYGVIFSLAVLFIVMFTRLFIGGVGLQIMLHLIMCILSVQYAIIVDQKNFLRRFLNVVIFFATVSLVFYFAFLLFPALVDLWPAERYYVQTIGISEWANDYYGKGLLLYSRLDIHPYRNCGIFTEPGVYQVVLNSALFVLLFWKDKFVLKSCKQYYIYVIVVFATIMTCQSTTGFLATIMIVGVYLLFYRQSKATVIKMKRLIGVILFIILAILFIDYSSRGENSILYEQIIIKLFPEGSFDVSAGSGQYRLGMIEYALSIIMKNPLGVGYDVFNSGLAQGDVAASLISYAAVYGVPAIIVMLLFVFIPVFKYERPIIAILFVLLFVNTTLAQTDLFYPTQLIIPIYLATAREHGRDIKNKDYSYEKSLNFV